MTLKPIPKLLIKILICVVLFKFYFLISLFDYSGDVKNHVAWGKSIVEFGTYEFYSRTFPGFSFPTYPSFIMLFFGFCYFIYQFTVSGIWFLNNTIGFFPSPLVHFFEWENVLISYLKIPGFLGTILSGWVIYKFFELFKKNQIKKKIIITALFLFNPAVLYITSVWGQTDLLQYGFILLALYLLFKEKFWWAVFAGSLALLSKNTAIILWGVFILTLLWQKGFKKAVQAILGTILIFYLFYMPFHSLSFTWPIAFYIESFSIVNFLLHENAINLWAYISNFQSVDSTQRFLIFSYDLWGQLLFGLISAPLTILLLWRKLKYETFFHYLFIISITYFFFLTRMHERYLIPAVMFGAITIFFGKKYYLSYLFISGLHFINLYRGLFVPSNDFLSMLGRNITFLNGLVIVYGAIIVFNVYLFIKNVTLIKDEK